MDARSWTIDVGDADFEREVIARSTKTPVVVDFWAPWCAPCRVLGPVLERLAAEYAGAFVLAKVNVDEAPGIAGVLGVRSIPAVKGFRDGALVAEFIGAHSEGVVRDFLTRMLPTEADRLARTAAEALASGDTGAAEQGFRAALAIDGRHGHALVGLAGILGGRGELEEALHLLDLVLPSAPVAGEAERLAARLRTKTDASADEATLRERLAADPTDLSTRVRLGHVLAAQERYEEALAELLTAVRQEAHFDDDAARKAMLDIFAVLGSGDPLVERYRADLAKALYR